MSDSYRCPLGYAWRDANAMALIVARRMGVLGSSEPAELVEGAKASVPFYPRHQLLRVRRRDWDHARAFYYIVPRETPAAPDRGEWVRLNGKSVPIHMVNERVALSLSEHHASAYLRFFCFFVHGDEGAFALVEYARDPVMPPDVPDAMRLVLESAARPVAASRHDSEGRHLLSGVVWYGHALFRADFAIAPDGGAEMLEDDPIAANLPLAPAWRLT